MHELSITESILEIAIDEARRAGASRIEKIRLKVGALTEVVPDSIQFYLDAVAPGTIAEGVRLETIAVPTGATCTRCSHFFVVAENALQCPACGGMGRITQGRELFIESLEVGT